MAPKLPRDADRALIVNIWECLDYEAQKTIRQRFKRFKPPKEPESPPPFKPCIPSMSVEEIEEIMRDNQDVAR